MLAAALRERRREELRRLHEPAQRLARAAVVEVEGRERVARRHLVDVQTPLSVAAHDCRVQCSELSVSCQCMRAASSHVTRLVHGLKQVAGGEGQKHLVRHRAELGGGRRVGVARGLVCSGTRGVRTASVSAAADWAIVLRR